MSQDDGSLLVISLAESTTHTNNSSQPCTADVPKNPKPRSSDPTAAAEDEEAAAGSSRYEQMNREK